MWVNLQSLGKLIIEGLWGIKGMQYQVHNEWPIEKFALFQVLVSKA